MSQTQTDTALVADIPRKVSETEFTGGQFLDDIKARVRAIVDEFRARGHSAETSEGRDEIRSFAYKIKRSKTAVDELGKQLSQDLRRRQDGIGSVRKNAQAFFDELHENVRAPLTEWERTEQERKDALEERVRGIQASASVHPDEDSASVRRRMDELRALAIGEDFDEFREAAETARDSALHRLGEAVRDLESREAEKAELERLRREQAEKDAELERLRAREREREEAERAEPQKEPAPEIDSPTGRDDTSPRTANDRRGEAIAYLVEKHGLDTGQAERLLAAIIGGEVPGVRWQ